MRLRYMPRGVYVKMDKFKEDLGNGEGVIFVRPTQASCKYKTKLGKYSKTKEVGMRRYQISLGPEKVRTVETAQGMSMDAAQMILSAPTNMGKEDWWLHVYVMLSRVRTAKRCLIFGELPPQWLFEQGPPQWIVESLSRLQQMADRFGDHVSAAKQKLGWPQSGGPTSTDVSSRPTEARSGAQQGASIQERHGREAIGLKRPPEPSSEVPRSKVPRLQAQGTHASVSQGSSSMLAPSRYRALDECYQSELARMAPSAVEAAISASAASLASKFDLCTEVYHLPRAEVQMAAVKQEQTPGAGLDTLGGSCFVNAAMQCFFSVQAYTQLMLAHARRCSLGSGSCVCCALAEAYTRCRQDAEAVVPSLALLARRGVLGDKYRLEAGQKDEDAQADAAGFLQAMFDEIHAQEYGHVGAHIKSDLSARDFPHVLQEQVQGCLLRVRTGCLACKAASDHLKWVDMVSLSAGEGKDDGAVDLKRLWQQHLSQKSSPSVRCPRLSGGCERHAWQQVFLERAECSDHTSAKGSARTICAQGARGASASGKDKGI